MDANIGLANRRLQPLGHLSKRCNAYASSVLPSNPTGESGESGESKGVCRGPKSGPTPRAIYAVERPAESRRRRYLNGLQGALRRRSGRYSGGPGSGHTETAALIALMAVLLAAFIGTAWLVSVPCRPGDRGFYIGHAMLMAGCPEPR